MLRNNTFIKAIKENDITKAKTKADAIEQDLHAFFALTNKSDSKSKLNTKIRNSDPAAYLTSDAGISTLLDSFYKCSLPKNTTTLIQLFKSKNRIPSQTLIDELIIKFHSLSTPQILEVIDLIAHFSKQGQYNLNILNPSLPFKNNVIYTSDPKHTTSFISKAPFLCSIKKLRNLPTPPLTTAGLICLHNTYCSLIKVGYNNIPFSTKFIKKNASECDIFKRALSSSTYSWIKDISLFQSYNTLLEKYEEDNSLSTLTEYDWNQNLFLLFPFPNFFKKILYLYLNSTDIKKNEEAQSLLKHILTHASNKNYITIREQQPSYCDITTFSHNEIYNLLKNNHITVDTFLYTQKSNKHSLYLVEKAYKNNLLSKNTILNHFTLLELLQSNISIIELEDIPPNPTNTERLLGCNLSSNTQSSSESYYIEQISVLLNIILSRFPQFIHLNNWITLFRKELNSSTAVKKSFIPIYLLPKLKLNQTNSIEAYLTIVHFIHTSKTTNLNTSDSNTLSYLTFESLYATQFKDTLKNTILESRHSFLKYLQNNPTVKQLLRENVQNIRSQLSQYGSSYNYRYLDKSSRSNPYINQILTFPELRCTTTLNLLLYLFHIDAFEDLKLIPPFRYLLFLNDLSNTMSYKSNFKSGYALFINYIFIKYFFGKSPNDIKHTSVTRSQIPFNYSVYAERNRDTLTDLIYQLEFNLFPIISELLPDIKRSLPPNLVDRINLLRNYNSPLVLEYFSNIKDAQ